MFTGIVETAVEVRHVEDHPAGRRLVIGHRFGDESPGQSIAVNGCCLTIAEILDDALAFDVVHESLNKTNLGLLSKGSRVHVEQALRPTDRLDGHFVQGHIDGRAEIVARFVDPGDWRLRLRVVPELARFIFPKGSVALDGVSLTVAALEGNEFEVALIPTTLEKTAFGTYEPGWPINFEADILAKGVVHTLSRMGFDRGTSLFAHRAVEGDDIERRFAGK